MINKKVESYLKELGCSFVKDEPVNASERILDRIDKEKTMFGFSIDKEGNTKTEVAVLVTEKSDREKQNYLFNIAKYVRTDYALLAIDQGNDKFDYYWFDVESSLPINEVPEFSSASEYFVKSEDIAGVFWQAANILRNISSADDYHEFILHLLMTRSYLDEKNKTSKWFDLDLDQINKVLEEALNHYEIESSFRFKDINDKELKSLLYKMSNLPPKSKVYNDAILSLMAKGRVYQGNEHGTSNKFKDVLVDIVKSIDIKPEKIADLTAGYGFTLRDLAMINKKSKVLGVEINEGVANYNKILNVITGLGNIDVLNEDSLAYNFKDKFDLISIRPPFGMMSKKDNNYDFEVLNRSRRNLSDAFIEQAINLTKENGYIIAVVTEGTLFTRKSKVLREIILEKTNVRGLIRLPNRTFPETAIKTTVLVLQKKKKGSKEPEKFFAGDIEDLKETDELIKSFQKFVKKGGKA